MTKQELIKELSNALENNSLLTDKHDPNKIHVPTKKARTVISHQIVADLQSFIYKGIDKVIEYQNNGGSYYVIFPKNIYEFASSGVIAYETNPFAGYDRVIAVNSKNLKWHIFGNDSSLIERDYISGQLRNPKKLE